MAENDMVERVARAIEDRLRGKDFLSYEEAARAAIEAMREPTDAMADDGYRAIKHGADAVWRAMIDAALNPEAGK